MANNINIFVYAAGNFEQMSIGAWRCLQSDRKKFFRTAMHPVVQELEAKGVVYQSFDQVYEKHTKFSDVYEEIVAKLLKEAASEDIIYGVPGHPMIAEVTTQKLLEAQHNGQIQIQMYSAPSFLDEMFTALEVDPVDGFLLLDATNFSVADLQLHKHMIFTQVYDAYVASEVKLALLEGLPFDYPVTVLSGVGTSNEKIQQRQLCELDHCLSVDNLRSVYIPPVALEALLPLYDFSTLIQIISVLRGPNGCPWDQKQTHESLKKYLQEETKELLEAIDAQDSLRMEEELGDVLLQVILHAQIAAEKGEFSIFDVIQTLNEKMIRRHPHVFGDQKADTVEEVIEIWKEIKEKE